MKKEVITIGLTQGLGANSVAMLVQIASQFESSIYMESGNYHVNAKSIMGMMSLGYNNGEALTFTADGPDEEAALAEIRQYLSR